MAFFAALPWLGAEVAGAVGVEGASSFVVGNIIRQIGIQGARQVAVNTARTVATEVATETLAPLAVAGLGTAGVAGAVGEVVIPAVAEALASGAIAEGVGTLATEAVAGGIAETIATTVASTAVEDTLVGAGLAEELGGTSITLAEAGTAGTVEAVADTGAITDVVLGAEGGGALLIPEEAGLMAQLEYQLADLGITREGVGEYTWNQIVGAIAGGAYTVEELSNMMNGDFPSVFNDIIDGITNSRDGIGSVQELVFIDANGNIVNNPMMANFSYIDPFQLGYSSAKILAGAGYYKALYGKNKYLDVDLMVAMLRSSSENPSDAYISKKLTSYLLSSEYLKNPDKNIQLYEQIYQVYDGNFKGTCIKKDPIYGELYGVIDETGKKIYYTGSRGTTKVFGYDFDVPSLHKSGGYVGPASPNRIPIDVEPTEIIQNGDETIYIGKVLDNLNAIALLHDEAYQQNSFGNSFGDFQLLSRINHMFNRGDDWGSSSTAYKAQFTAFYFANVAPLASAIMSNKDLNNMAVNDFLSKDEGDFYSYMMKMFKQPTDNTIKYGYSAVRGTRLVRNEGRNYFYAGLKQGLDDAFKLYAEKYFDEVVKVRFDNLSIG